MSRSRKLPKDPNQLAAEIVRISTEEKEQPQEKKIKPSSNRSAISKYLAKIGRKGGLKGGKARAKKLSPRKRAEISRKAAEARWKKHK